MNALSISRGWAVLTSDGKRVGDVTEVHPTYVLVSQGVLIVRDMYLPLGTIDRVENKTVILTVTHEMLRRMDLKHKPPDYLEPATEPVHDPEQVDYPAPEYGADAMATGDAIDATSEWPTTPIVPYDEMPTYVKPQPNGLVEVDHGLTARSMILATGKPSCYCRAGHLIARCGSRCPRCLPLTAGW